MDFESLLHVARKNQLHKKEPVKCLQTKFKPPTKAQREKDRALSDGVQRFLARKEEEERKKRKDNEKKLEELSALRARDPKANKRIQTMLKRTKSANKSVMNDVDASNTADTIGGPSQPDEDDYGFVSETSSALYNKLIQKMYSAPSDDLPKFAPSKKPSSGNLSNTKERVKMALIKQEEDEKLPHKRKRRKKEEGGADDDEGLSFQAPDRNVEEHSRDSAKFEKPKPKRPPGPPPMDFMELLRLAEKKQHEPVAIESKVKKTEPDQLMTKRQREEHRKMEEWKRQRAARLRALERGETPPQVTLDKPEFKRIPKIGQSSSEPRIPKLSQISEEVKAPRPESKPSKPTEPSNDGYKSSEKSKSVTRPSFNSNVSKSKPAAGSSDRVSSKPYESETEKLRRERDEALRVLKEKEAAFKLLEEKEKIMRERDEALAKLKQLEERESQVKKAAKPALSASKTVQDTRKPPPKTGVIDVRRPEPAKGGREFPPKDVRRPEPPRGGREFPPKDMIRPPPLKGGREFPPRDVRRPMKGGERPLTKEQIVRKRLAELKKRRQEEDSEEEYDSELDDFIDDDPDPNHAREDVSKVISQIFNYDKHKYSRYDDDGDECMESNWAQISKEEYLSTKAGLMEDLEDIKAEKAALARKKKKR